MKKVLTFLLLITMLFMAACSDGNTGGKTEGNADMPPVGGITTPTEAPTEDSHKGWTLLFGEVYIPELPFADWSGQNQDNISCYTVFINSTDSAAFHTYAQSLTGFGYTIEQNNSYSYKGNDPEGRRIHLTDHENGHMEIAIYYNTN